MSTPIPPWEPLSEPVLADQRGTYDRMRAACPVARSPRGVTLFRHADVVAVASDPRTFSSAASAFRSVPNTLDPPEHARFRSVVDRFFTPDRMAALEPVVRRIAAEAVAEVGPRTDAVGDVARSLVACAVTVDTQGEIVAQMAAQIEEDRFLRGRGLAFQRQQS